MKFIGNWKLYAYGSYDVVYISLHPHFWGFANSYKEAAQISSLLPLVILSGDVEKLLIVQN